MIKIIILNILNFFDFFHKLKIIKFMKKNKVSTKIVFDIGAHHGESLLLYCKNFKIESIYSFEPIYENFNKLENVKKKINKNYKTKVYLENLACGEIEKNIEIQKLNESSSSTIKKINFESKYFKKKNFFLNLKKNFTVSKIKQIKLSEYIKKKFINKIDFIKIDTEGYELEVLKGLENDIKNVNCILFEHHYDNMINKGYKFSDINNLLLKNNFKQVLKLKMYFRKTFEYIYIKN